MRRRRSRAADGGTSTGTPTGTPTEVEAERTGGLAPQPGSGSMTGAVASGASWSAMGRLGTQGLQFLAGLVLARLLFPEDFGLLASVYVVTGFAVLFFDMGLSSALVYQRELRDEDATTAFWVNALGGIVFVGLLALLGPLVADFYGDDRLRWITPLAGLSFALSLGVTHSALLQRALRFKALALAEVAAAVVGNAVTLVAAARGLGPLALVTGPAVQSVVMTVLLWCCVRWRPRGFVRRDSLRRLWSFSGGVLGFSVVNFAGRNSDNLFIGRFLGAAPLGYYNRAYNLMLLPLQQVSQVLGRVMFPVMAAMGDDLPRLQRAYRRSIRVMTAVTMPVLVGMAAVADGLVPLLWGERWLATVPLLQVLCLAGLPQCISSSEGWIYRSRGKTALMFKMGLLSTVVGVTGIVVGLQWGVQGVTFGILATAWLFQPVGLHVSCSLIELPGRRVQLDILPTVLLCLLMGAAVWAFPLLLGAPRDAPWVVGVQVLLGVVLYGGSMRLLRREVVADLLDLTVRRGRAGVPA